MDLVSSSLLGTCQVEGEVERLEVIMDPAQDCVHLLVTTAQAQWRLLLEQRSLGWVWGGEGGAGAPPSRGRLQGLAQLSVEAVAGLRARLAEGRGRGRAANTTETRPGRPLPVRLGGVRLGVEQGVGQNCPAFLTAIQDSYLTLHTAKVSRRNKKFVID